MTRFSTGSLCFSFFKFSNDEIVYLSVMGLKDLL